MVCDIVLLARLQSAAQGFGAKLIGQSVTTEDNVLNVPEETIIMNRTSCIK